jgi:hypothetical protein
MQISEQQRQAKAGASVLYGDLEKDERNSQI